MKFILYTNALSAHQIPLAKEVVKRIGAHNFRYIYTSKNGQRLQESSATDNWIEYLSIEKTNERLENADIMLVGGIRPIDLMARRIAKGKTTLYMSERWFKPAIGMLRLLHPKYFLMAWRIVRLIRNSASFTYLPIGIHAARDMARLCGFFSGDLHCLFRAPKLDFERKPGGKIWLKNGGDGRRYCLNKMRMWGYFVEPSQLPHSQLLHSPTLKVLWVGRLLNWKRVDTIIRAVGELSKSHSPTPNSPTPNSSTPNSLTPPLTLDLYGTGPEEKRLKKLASKYGDVIKFYPPVPIDEIRCLMRNHDVYVLASNAYEGWGAVVSEALEEGMKVVGTYEAGSSATILPKECLFHAGEWKRLLESLQNGVHGVGIGEWTAANASKVLKV